MADELSKLTRSLMIGASVGTVALVTVGCAPVAAPEAQTETVDGKTVIMVPASQKIACDRVMKSWSASDMNELIKLFPDSKCINPLLNVLPAREISGLDPAGLSGLSPSVKKGLPERVSSQFPDIKSPAKVPDRFAQNDGSNY